MNTTDALALQAAQTIMELVKEHPLLAQDTRLKAGIQVIVGRAIKGACHTMAIEIEYQARIAFHGIDRTENEVNYGWWETSTGAQFGHDKMEALTTLIQNAVPK